MQEFFICKNCKKPRQFTSKAEYAEHLATVHGIRGQKEQQDSIKKALEVLAQKEQDIKLAVADLKEREAGLDKREAELKAREDALAKTLEGNTKAAEGTGKK